MNCKVANTEEIHQIFAQVFAVWPHDPDPVVHLQKRLASIQHQRATWFAIEDQGTVVASLGAYPVQLFGPDGDRPARAFGAVFTPEAQRGRGHAKQLIRWVQDYYASQGTQDFILYSDIDPAYYQKLGFQTLPSYEWSWDLGPGEPKIELMTFPARPMDPGSQGFRFGIRRVTEDARWVQDKQNTELRFSRCLDSGMWLLSRLDQGTYTLLETNLSQMALDWDRLVQFVESDARLAGCQRVKSWWLSPEKSPVPALQSVIKPRPVEILMWASLRTGDPWCEQIGQHGFRAFLSEHV